MPLLAVDMTFSACRSSLRFLPFVKVLYFLSPFSRVVRRRRRLGEEGYLVRFSFFVLFISKTIMFRVVVDRYEFHSEDIQSEAFSLVKQISFDNVPDIGARERMEYSMDDEYVLQFVTSFSDATFQI